MRNALLSIDDQRDGRRVEVAVATLSTGRIAPGAPGKVKLDGRVKASNPALDALVLRCLAKAPSQRFKSARALEEALVEIAKSLPPWTGDEARAYWADRARDKEDRSSAVPSSVLPLS